MQAERRREPWPWILAALLVSMMAISTSFAWIAHGWPDPEVVDERYEESPRAGFVPRPTEGSK